MSCCAPAATRSRAARRRSSRTSSPSACSACRGSRPPPREERAMNFGFTDDQQEIKRTARDLLANRSTFERVREAAEAGRYDDALWRELAALGWPGIAVAEDHGGQGLGAV